MSQQKVIDELERIAVINGGILRPGDVVEAARPEKSVLHSRFEWNDTLAAAAYRVAQARELIQVTVTLVGPRDQPVSSRVFVSLTSDRYAGGGYRLMADVLDNQALRQQMLMEAFEEMRRFEQKYADLKELERVFLAMKLAGEKPVSDVA